MTTIYVNIMFIYLQLKYLCVHTDTAYSKFILMEALLFFIWVSFCPQQGSWVFSMSHKNISESQCQNFYQDSY